LFENYDAIICDGAIRSGKTVCMGISFVMWAFYKFNDNAFAFCGKTIRSLRRNLIVPIIPLLTSIGFCCKEKFSENVLEIFYEGRRNIFYFFGGKDKSSASLIQGLTLSGILFDEAALMPKSFIEQALARCSSANSKFWFNCNPDYPQHWFYKEWILKKETRKVFYVHFCMEDNPSLGKKTIERYKNLYSGAFYQRFIEGKWVAADGLVYPFMTNEAAFVDLPQGTFSKFAVSCDYGIVNPTSCGLWGEKNGIWYRIDEYYYDSRTEGESCTDEEHYRNLCELIGNKNISCIAVDPSAASFIAILRKNGGFNVLPAKNNIIDGIRKVSTVLKNGSVKICKNCESSKREFSLYRWEEGGVKDTPVKENDHAMDDIRYFVSTIVSADDEDPFFAFAAQR
jgi:PBSX family phage terminase large subunit